MLSVQALCLNNRLLLNHKEKCMLGLVLLFVVDSLVLFAVDVEFMLLLVLLWLLF